MISLHRTQNSWTGYALCFVVAALVLGQGIAVGQDGDGEKGAAEPIDFCGDFEGNSALEAAAGGLLINTLDINGGFTLNEPGAVPLFLITPNGVPDVANELGLLQAILNDENFDNGLITHAEVQEAWDDNFRTLTKSHIGDSILPHRPQTLALQQVAPGFIDILVAYLMLGDGTFVKNEVDGTIQATGSFGFVASVLDQFNGLLDQLRPLLPESLRGLINALSLFNPVLDKADFVSFDLLTVVDGADADGDGLSNREEFDIFAPTLCQVAAPAKGDVAVDYVAAALSPDADGDGMPDNFEVLHAVLDPSVPDGELDPDGDLLSNLDEFLENSDPDDIDSPKITRFVAGGGTSDPAGGTAGNHWNLATGLAQLGAGMGDSQLLLDPGTYTGDIVLWAGGGIVGPPSCDPGVLGDCAVLQGTVTGAYGAVVQDVTLQATVGNVVLLTVDSAGVEVRGVRFEGAGQSNVTGIQMSGIGSGDTLIARCLFTELAIGLEILDDIPTLRRSIFEISDNGITIRATSPKGVAKSLGSVTDPKSGFNSFLSSVTPFSVVDERGIDELSLQNNDWDIDEGLSQSAAEAAIEARIDGSALIVPFAAQGASILASALICVVTNSGTQAKISNASVELVQGTTVIGPVTRNDEAGVYLFPALTAGVYSVSVSVPGLEEQLATRSLEVSLAAGELGAINIALSAPKVEEPPTGGGGCYAGGTSDGVSGSGGDIALVLLLVMGLVYAGRVRRDTA